VAGNPGLGSACGLPARALEGYKPTSRAIRGRSIAPPDRRFEMKALEFERTRRPPVIVQTVAAQYRWDLAVAAPDP